MRRPIGATSRTAPDTENDVYSVGIPGLLNRPP